MKDKGAPDNLSYVYSVLSHPLRRKIIEIVAEDDVSFTELMQKLGFKETGKLTFHLRHMERVLEKTSDGKYRLSDLGKTTHKISVEGEKDTGLRKFSPTEEIKKRVTELSSDFAGLLFSPSTTLKRAYCSQDSFLPFPIFLIFLFPLTAFIFRHDLSELITETTASFFIWVASVYLFKHISEHFYRKQINLHNMLYTTGLASFPLILARVTFILTQPFSDLDKLIFSSSSIEEIVNKIFPIISKPTIFLGLTVTCCLIVWSIYLEICALEKATKSA